MRCLGEIHGRKSAEQFVAHLLTLGVDIKIDAQEPLATQRSNASQAIPPSRTTSAAAQPGDVWELWVRDEDQFTLAQAELKSYLNNPQDPKYAAAISKANEIVDQRVKARQAALKNLKKLESKTTSAQSLVGGGRIPPLTLTLFALCTIVGFVTNFAEVGPNNEFGSGVLNALRFASVEDIVATDGDPAASLKQGEVWRAVTPIFIHIGIIHFAMNMFMLISFGRIVERWMGTPRFAMMVLALALLPNLLQGLSPEWMHGSWRFGGISGVLYGFLSYVWIRTTINPRHGIAIPMPMIVFAVGLIVVGLSGVAGDQWPFADLCHLGGLLVGAAFGFASEQSTASKL